MEKTSNRRHRFLHLYDPKEEGIGSYDLNYMNAKRKEKIISDLMKNNYRRNAA